MDYTQSAEQALEYAKTALSNAAAKIESMLGDILAYLGPVGDGAAEYGKVLEAFTGKIDNTESAGDLKTIISGVPSETRTVVMVNKALESKLDLSWKKQRPEPGGIPRPDDGSGTGFRFLIIPLIAAAAGACKLPVL